MAAAAMPSFCVAIITVSILFCSSFANTMAAQDSGNYLYQGGLQSYSDPQAVEYGYVEQSNGHLHLEIPLGDAVTQRGGASHQVRLTYDSNVWSPDETFVGTLVWGAASGWGVTGIDEKTLACYYPSGPCTYYDNWSNLGATVHTFPGYYSDGYATDASGYYLRNLGQNAIVYAPNGSVAFSQAVGTPNTPLPGTTIDPNGNYAMHCNYAGTPAGQTIGDCDANGRAFFTALQGGGSPLGTITVPNSQGTTSSYVVTDSIIQISSNFGYQGIQECTGSTCTNGVTTSIQLPDGTSYSFKYDCDQTIASQAAFCDSPGGRAAYYGQLSTLQPPSGGAIHYSYQPFKDAYGYEGTWLASRVADGGTTTYTPQIITSCATTSQVGCQQKLTVNYPSGKTVVTTFTLDNGSWPVEVDTSNATGTTLSSETIAYDFSHPCVVQGCVGHDYVKKISDTTTINSPSVPPLIKGTFYGYDSPQDGLITSVKEYDFVQNANSLQGVPTRGTYTAYYSPAGGGGVAGFNIHKPSKITVCNNLNTVPPGDPDCIGGGQKSKQTIISYDTGTLTSVTGIVNHDDSDYGSGATVRGNPTQVQEWVSGSGFVSTSYQYDTTGQVILKTDPNGHHTSYSYDDRYFNSNNLTSLSPYTPASPTHAYPTTITPDAVGSASGVTTIGYYFGTGQVAQTVDPNHLTTSAFFDTLGRPALVQSQAGWSLTSYTSANQIDSYSAVGDTSPGTSCTSCVHTQTTLDGLGRRSSVSTVNAPGGSITTDTTYDSSGRVYTVSHPYSSVEDKVDEVFSYDELDRVVSVMHPDHQAVTTSYGSVWNNVYQSTPTYFPLYPMFTTDEAGKVNQKWTDAFGRLREVDEPAASQSPSYSAPVYVNGQEQFIPTDPSCDPNTVTCPPGTADVGSIALEINGTFVGVGYGDGSVQGTIQQDLAGAITRAGIAGVTASYDPTVGLTIYGPGPYSLSASVQSNFGSGVITNGPGPSISWDVEVPSALTLSSGTTGPTAVATLYTYDVLGNLVKTAQDSQVRNFTYDGLSRLTSSQNPEISDASNAMCSVLYSYDNNSNLYSKTSPLHNQTSCSTTVTATYGPYDAWNRSPGTTYQGDSTPGVSYTYDQGGASANAIGRMTHVSDGAGSANYSYDQSGNAIQVDRTVGTKTYTTKLRYNLASEPIQITYPSGRMVYPSYDNIGRLSGVASGGTTYFSVPSGGYDASGHILTENFGNGVVGNFVYSPDRSQLTNLSYSKNQTDLLALNYAYTSADCPFCNTGMTSFNNGLIQCIQDVTGADQAGRSASYSYDAVNRLATAVTSGTTAYPQWGLRWSYDRFGNRMSQTVIAGTATSLGTPADPVTNRVPSILGYDAPGNVTNSSATGGSFIGYDAENRVVNYANGVGSYGYDASGTRVTKAVGGATTIYAGLGGQTLAEYDSASDVTSPAHEYIYAGSQMVADISNGSAVYHQPDHLSTRLLTDANGTVVGERGHFPFGDIWYETGTTTKYKFTGKERDTESGLDYFGARYYGSSMGRFMSPDPSGLVFASLANPQSLNLYSYAQNNPLIYTDPTGLDCAYLNDSGTAIEDGGLDQQSTSTECGQNGGYWVDGSMTDAQINANAGTVQLAGTNDGNDTTYASYQDTNVFVDSWLNMAANQAGHMTIGLAGHQQVGQNPMSDGIFLSNAVIFGLKNTFVSGSIQNESTSKGTPGTLRSFAIIPVTGMQAQMIQNSISQSTASPPNYSLNPALGLDCATWAQQVLHDAGIQTGPMQPYPNDLMRQLGTMYTVMPGH